MEERIDELLGLVEVEPEGLAAAELLQARAVLERLIGKSVTAATVDERRVTVTTSDGRRYYFYGFLGSDQAD
jgi:cell division septal protein FtsQ